MTGPFCMEDFETGRIDKDKRIRVKRFNDTYHNEAVIGLSLIHISLGGRQISYSFKTNII